MKVPVSAEVLSETNFFISDIGVIDSYRIYKVSDNSPVVDQTDDDVDELERLRRENLRLKKQLKEQEMINQLLKKVQEFERM